MLNPRFSVSTLPSYHPPLAGREGLRLDFNENTVGCSPRVLECLRSIGGEQLARYPEREPVEALIAEHWQLASEEVLLTNGIDEAIHLLCETYLEPEDEVLIPVPTFAMYELFAAATGAKIVKVQASDDFEIPTQDLLGTISEKTRLIVIANPNNPTGTVVEPEILLEVARSAPRAAVLVDEAYFEFFGETLLGQWRTAPNLVVARTFSKAYGLAGLRVGVLAGDASVIGLVRRVASPYSVNGVALACLPAALQDEEYVLTYASQVRQNREKLQDQLREWGVRFWPSQANFVLLYVGKLHSELVRAMRSQGILVRDRSNDPGCEGCVRVTVGSAQQTKCLIEALGVALTAFGILKRELSR